LHAAGILREFTVTNSIPQTTAAQGMSFLRVEDISAQFAWAIHQIHHGLPLPQPTPLQY
jgi:phosphoribosylpyrophosphate synthetase